MKRLLLLLAIAIISTLSFARATDDVTGTDSTTDTAEATANSQETASGIETPADMEVSVSEGSPEAEETTTGQEATDGTDAPPEAEAAPELTQPTEYDAKNTLEAEAQRVLNLPKLEMDMPYDTPSATSSKSYMLATTTDANDRSRWVDKWTFMHTNPGVRPFKVMEDLTFVGVPVFVAGIIAKGEKKAFRQNDGSRHVLLTNFKTHIDDYTQYFGPALTLGLKIGGVEGRSDWGRFLTSAALSYGIMAGLVNGIKYTAKEMRPDGSTRNSWPSGHTATSFVGATILHKEYGLTRSPWYSVAGYGVATATGIMRVLNNRHWVSDVLSGAGIGIMSTELAYALSDVIFKGKGLLRNNKDSIASIIQHPSFFAISMGLGWGSKNIDFDLEDDDPSNDFNLKFGTSTMVSVEAAYFFNKYIGVGGRLRVNTSPIKGWDRVLDYAKSDLQEIVQGIDQDAELSDFSNIIFNDEGRRPEYTIESDHLTEFACDLGIYGNLPLSRHFAIGAKLLGGRSIMQELNLKARYQGEVKEFTYITDKTTGEIDDVKIATKTNADGTPATYDYSWDYFVLDANNSFKLGTGISLTYAYKNNFSFRVFAEYDYTRKTYKLEYNPAEFLNLAMPDILAIASMEPELAEMYSPHQSIRRNRHTFIIGGSFAISF